MKLLTILKALIVLFIVTLEHGYRIKPYFLSAPCQKTTTCKRKSFTLLKQISNYLEEAAVLIFVKCSLSFQEYHHPSQELENLHDA